MPAIRDASVGRSCLAPAAGYASAATARRRRVNRPAYSTLTSKACPEAVLADEPVSSATRCSLPTKGCASHRLCPATPPCPTGCESRQTSIRRRSAGRSAGQSRSGSSVIRHTDRSVSGSRLERGPYALSEWSSTRAARSLAAEGSRRTEPYALGYPWPLQLPKARIRRLRMVPKMGSAFPLKGLNALQANAAAAPRAACRSIKPEGNGASRMGY